MKEPPARPIVIGLAGGSASGKTSLADALVLQWPASCTLSQDAYYRDPLPQGVGFDHPDAIEWSLLTQHVDALSRGATIRTPTYDFSTHRRRTDQTRKIAPQSIVIVEGLHVLGRGELDDHFALRLFVSVPADVRLIRRVRRDILERGRSLESVLVQYENEVRPMHASFVDPTRHQADLVLDGMLPPGDNVAIVAAFARRRGLSI